MGECLCDYVGGSVWRVCECDCVGEIGSMCVWQPSMISLSVCEGVIAWVCGCTCVGKSGSVWV